MSAPIDHAAIQRAMAPVQIVPTPADAQRLAAFAHRAEKIAMRGLLGFAGVLGAACIITQILKRIAL